MVGHRLVIRGRTEGASSSFLIARYIAANYAVLESNSTNIKGEVSVYACHPGLCPTCYVRNIVVRYNEIKNTTNGIQIAAVPSSWCNDESLGMSNIVVRDNLFHGLDARMSNGNAAEGNRYSRA